MSSSTEQAADIRTMQPEDCLDDNLAYFWRKPPEGQPFFKGRNFVLWNGWFVFGPLDGIRTVGFTFILIAVPSALFLAYPARALIYLLSPSMIVIGAVLVFVTLALLVLTATTDPGILPRFHPPQLGPDTILPLVQKFEVNGGLQKLKLCSTCQIYRRGGQGCFVILSFYVLACSLLHVILAKNYNGNGKFEFKRDVSEYSISFFLMLYSFIIGLTVGSLALFHTCLLFQKKTTREYILNISGEDVNYANRNTCSQFLCGKENFSFMKTILRRNDEDIADFVKAAEGPTEEEWNTASTPTENSQLMRRASSAAVDSVCTPRDEEEVDEEEDGREVGLEVALQVDEGSDVRIATTEQPNKKVSDLESAQPR
ncbi:hypothetical protein GUITHDRAFT_103836 [Guillardia theta CCMP2712]|uniref:protein S-acyltransferase n=1 Tax=Guillardia theta (strain CCMP2712) TaxID=905079 RepID=L1JR91_GUITC|nr:hypothetical protein GUITHDRAFT_103836 [Guillardia theta CCMP2712]EKX50613.1 hypothetical protein GUITHDRAFT_103836 [Guillardia theta CCMP2712]|eukprot:XP_005837593.1 hypothetical protein GUITHDRAFT_103836 [Guillardia theta CCMP2712]